MPVASLPTPDPDPAVIEWMCIEPGRSLAKRASSAAHENRPAARRPVWQYELEADISALVDPSASLLAYGGSFQWVQTPDHGLALLAKPGLEDPTVRPRNPLAECMLHLATRDRWPVFGAVAWCGDFHFGTHSYRPFPRQRLAAFNMLHSAALARLGPPRP